MFGPTKIPKMGKISDILLHSVMHVQNTLVAHSKTWIEKVVVACSKRFWMFLNVYVCFNVLKNAGACF